MSSDDLDLPISPEMLAERVRVVDVADLRPWAANPYDHDVGQATVYASTFGQTRLVVTHEGEVIYGWPQVAAELAEPIARGRVAALDLTDLGWSREKAAAAALGLLRADRLAVEDDRTLADLLLAIAAADSALLVAAGWDTSDVDYLLRSIEEGEGPVDFSAFDENDVKTEHECPKCGYQWSGQNNG